MADTITLRIRAFKAGQRRAKEHFHNTIFFSLSNRDSETAMEEYLRWDMPNASELEAVCYRHGWAAVLEAAFYKLFGMPPGQYKLVA